MFLYNIYKLTLISLLKKIYYPFLHKHIMHHFAFIVSSPCLTLCLLNKKSIHQSTRIYNARANRMDHLEQENHKLCEEVTTLQAENEIFRNLVSLMTVAQGQPLSLPIVSTQAQTVASTIPISTVFASTPQHVMLEGYL